MVVKTENGMKDVSLLQVTPENFIVPKGTEHLYHCIIEVKRFNADTGERLSKPRMQVFGQKTFEEVTQHYLAKHGYHILILHDPKEYNQAMREKAIFEEAQRQHEREVAAEEALRQAEKDAEELEAAKAKAQQDAIDKAVAEALARQDADMDAKIAEAIAAKTKESTNPEAIKPATEAKPKGSK